VLATATALSIHLLKTGEGLLHACISSSFIKNTLKREALREAFVVEFYLKLELILRIISYLTYICWEIDNFVIKSVFLGDL
jgi:hypothetical protein